MSEHGRRMRPVGHQRGALQTGFEAAGRLMGSLTRTTGHRRRAPEPERPRPDGVVEVVVDEGETVADIAARHGASTAGVLALNGLGWRTQVHTGAVLLVKPGTRPAPAGPADDLHRHRVADGETVSAIADRHGVATAAVLLANGMSRGSVVRSGQQLVIPVANTRRTGSGAVRLSGEMRENARLVVAAGRSLGIPDDGLVIALAAAMEESSLVGAGLAPDAVGVFQQRPVDGWGSDGALLDPYRAALAFFGDPRAGVARPAVGLLDVDGWPFMSVGEAAAAVLRTAAPAAYAKWERPAREWLRELDREAGR
ncbi:LysM peptidoglycan-binding domain-containing protein [Amnibacterium endophyticum]|uniref:LysM peptidoglycan-binding domain-containing protein n=1 Tax=Amnibacterium endophyticum TaxID=2109337 RepID=A0ABW4LCC4_9MICO